MGRVQAQDDEAAFAQLVSRWEGPIQRLCARMTGDEHGAQDLAQETFVRIFAARKSYRGTGKFSTWLWRIALNQCYNELRRRKSRRESPLEGADEEAVSLLDTFVAPEPAPDISLVETERGELVRQTLMRLPETYRTVLVLRHYQDLKFREIAEVLDVPDGTVKSRMAEALARMSRLLQPKMENRPAHHLRTENKSKESLTT